MSDASGEEASRARRVRLLVLAQAASAVLVVALFSLLVWTVARGSSGADLVAAIKRDQRPVAPSFDLPVIWNRPENWPLRTRPALSDGRIRLEELRGTPVVLNFWASWCIPCKEEAPFLAAAARAHRRNVAFLGLDIQDFESDARRFLRRLDVPYPSARETGSEIHSAYGLTGVPETYYIDARGRVVAHATGAVSREELESGIALLTGERAR
jgi:cytochrome c biogenesis protein CcmG/thiol:disulfide interchange protein DsbE